VNGRSFRLLTVFGMPVYIHWTWFIIFALLTWSLQDSWFPNYGPQVSRALPSAIHWVMGAVAAILLFVSVLLHELGHSFLARHHHIPVRGITLFLFGGVAEITEEPASPRAEAEVTVAGWVVTASIALVCFLTLAALPLTTHLLAAVAGILYYLMFINLMLLAFNAVPGFPLDGGRLLRALLWWRTGNLRRATYMASSVGAAVGIVFMTIGGLMTLLAGEVVGGVWLFLIGLFLRGAARANYQQLLIRRALEGVPISHLMATDVVCIPGEVTLEQAVNEWFFRYRYDGFPVCGPDGLAGMLTLDQVRSRDRSRWSMTTVAQAMDGRAREYAAPAHMDAMHVLARMSQYDVGSIPVVDGGQLVGIVTRRDIMKLLRLKTDLEGLQED
jgi:Zn-dependent protease/CBS domain-containing protein